MLSQLDPEGAIGAIHKDDSAGGVHGPPRTVEKLCDVLRRIELEGEPVAGLAHLDARSFPRLTYGEEHAWTATSTAVCALLIIVVHGLRTLRFFGRCGYRLGHAPLANRLLR